MACCHPMIPCCTSRRPLNQVWALIACCRLKVLLQLTVGVMILVLVVVSHLPKLPQQLQLLPAICSLTSLICCPHSFRTSPHNCTVHLFFLPLLRHLSQAPKNELYHDKTASLSTTSVPRRHRLLPPRLTPSSITSVVEFLGISRPLILVMPASPAVHLESIVLRLTINLHPEQSSTDLLYSPLMVLPHPHLLVDQERDRKVVPVVATPRPALGPPPEHPTHHLLHPPPHLLPHHPLLHLHLLVLVNLTPFQLLALHLHPLGSSRPPSLCLIPRKHTPRPHLALLTPPSRRFLKLVYQAMAPQ